MRVPLSLLRKLVPFDVPAPELARVMNARVSEVEHTLEMPCAADVAHLAVRAGVICDASGKPTSEAALGIGDDTGPLRVGPDVAEGTGAYEALGLDDVVLEFDLEPNRPDLFSLVGMARDVAAIYDLPLSLPESYEGEFPGVSDIEVRVEATDRVPRYCALHMSGIVVGPSPQWLQNAVRKLGMRPINNVVDAANLVMMELGEPMHTFDRRHIESGVIGLRMARPGEQFATLDGVQRTLTDECLLVTDGPEPVALAGIMGGRDSEVKDDTTQIVIEAACFDMATVRRGSRRLSLRTEASLRFEKGLPATGVLPAVRRLAHVLRLVAGPDVRIGAFTEHYPEPPARRAVALEPEWVRTRLAADVDDARMAHILTRLGCSVAGDWTVTLPHHRPDLRIAQDLVEEVGRINGYEHVRAELPVAQLAPVRHNPLFYRAFQVRRTLGAFGLDEVYLGPWFSEAEVERHGLDKSSLVELKNPLSLEWRYFRSSALPGVVAAAGENRKLFDGYGFYEIASIYRRIGGEVREAPHLAGAVGGDAEAAFYTTRDVLARLFDRLGIEAGVDRLQGTPEWLPLSNLHPGRWGAFVHQGETLAVFGQLHPTVARAADLRDAPVVFAADLARIYQLADDHRRHFTPPPRFPSIESHVNVLAPERLMAARLLGRIAAENLVRRTVRDVWTGKGVPEGKRRLTLELEFNGGERSLTHEEVMGQVRAIQASLQSDPEIVVEIPG